MLKVHREKWIHLELVLSIERYNFLRIDWFFKQEMSTGNKKALKVHPQPVRFSCPCYFNYARTQGYFSQTHGTAKNTTMAIAFANVSMAKKEYYHPEYN